MKRMPTIIAWVGVAIVLLAAWPTLVISWEWVVRPEMAGRVTEGIVISFALVVLGLLPTAIGGFFSKSRAVAWGIIVADAVYLLAFVPWAVRVPSGHEWVIALPPGVWCLMCGFVLLAKRHRGWWLAVVLGVPVATIVGAFVIHLASAPVYQPVELQSPEVGSGEIVLNLGPPGGYYRLVTTERDSYIREYLRLWVQGTDSTYIEVRAPRNGMLMPLLKAGSVPLDQITVPEVGYEAVVWTEDVTGHHGLKVEYSERASWSLNVRPVCISYTNWGDEERYVVFRLKEHVRGERMVLEYRYVQPAPP